MYFKEVNPIMRITKEAEERRNEILDAAGELFMINGYDKTSTNAILDKVGIARGTLYYHFKSKEEIMDAWIQRSMQKIVVAAQSIADDKTIPVMDRFTQMMGAIKIENSEDHTMMEGMHKPQNALLHQKINHAIIKNITPVFTSVVMDGIKEGLFQTDFPYECMEMAITYANVAFDNYYSELSEEEQNHKMVAMFYHIERMLCSGTINFTEEFDKGVNENEKK